MKLKRGAVKEELPIQGAANWTDLWPHWDDVGDEFALTGTQTHPLHQIQYEKLRSTTTHLGEYRIYYFEKRLGSGHFGEVWKVMCQKRLADDLEDEWDVERWGPPMEAACKVLRLKTKHKNAKKDLSKCMADLMRDYLVLRYEKDPKDPVNHNLIRLYDFVAIPDTKTGFPYSTVLMLMELCTGDLNKIAGVFYHTGIPEPLPEDLSRKWMTDICHAIHFLHSRNVVHMDIKPDNILFKWAIPGTASNRHNFEHNYNSLIFYLSDFGLARVFRDDEVAEARDLRGTLKYMSPEMVKIRTDPKRPVHTYRPILIKPCDIYSLGVTLVFSMIEYDEFEARVDNKFSLQLLVYNVANGTEFEPNLTPESARLIYEMLQREPFKRPTIEQVMADPWLTGAP